MNIKTASQSLVGSVCCIVLLLANAAASFAEDQVIFRTETCFAGMIPSGICPTIITVVNKGAPLDGALAVQSQGMENGRRYLYPLSLPTGSTKKVIVYPRVESYGGGLAISYASGFRVWDTTMPFQIRSSGQRQVGMIGDRMGGVAVRNASLNVKNRGRSEAFNDCYCKPENAPDRASGYSALASLIIGEGAERLNAAQWDAIGQWTLRGGSLILLGGANAAYLRIPEARFLLPIADPTGKTMNSGALLNSLEGASGIPDLPMAVTVGTPIAGASLVLSRAGLPLMVRMLRGTGTILYVAYDPLEKPIRGTLASAFVWQQILQSGKPVVDETGIAAIVNNKRSAFDGNENRYGYTTPSTRMVRVMRGGKMVYIPSPMAMPAQPAVNPFHIKLPPVETVVGIFLLYFVLAVPVTFAVLRRLDKQEWAWITAPLLSVLFSLGLYLFTADLYKAGMSRRTGGVVIAAEGEREARFSGFTEIFFPAGGSYKIAIPNDESLEVRDDNPDYGFRPGSTDNRSALETVDTGYLVAPNYNVTNLSFRRLAHGQKVGFGDGITAQIHKTNGNSGFSGSVHNGTETTLKDTVVHLPGDKMATMGDIAPGETKTLSASEESGMAANSDNLSITLPTDAPNALLSANSDGEKYGPGLGRSVGGDSSVKVLVSLPVSR